MFWDLSACPRDLCKVLDLTWFHVRHLKQTQELRCLILVNSHCNWTLKWSAKINKGSTPLSIHLIGCSFVCLSVWLVVHLYICFDWSVCHSSYFAANITWYLLKYQALQKAEYSMDLLIKISLEKVCNVKMNEIYLAEFCVGATCYQL